MSEELALAAVEHYARQYPELLRKDQHTALTTLIQTRPQALITTALPTLIGVTLKSSGQTLDRYP
ncbi:MAG: hypothetical protein IPL59_26930 [Candidatus Competibacteraceae bacterium]|nr:hypothetical protein [Candidatus Competibacteraceae bacterium]